MGSAYEIPHFLNCNILLKTKQKISESYPFITKLKAFKKYPFPRPRNHRNLENKYSAQISYDKSHLTTFFLKSRMPVPT